MADKPLPGQADSEGHQQPEDSEVIEDDDKDQSHASEKRFQQHDDPLFDQTDSELPPLPSEGDSLLQGTVEPLDSEDSINTSALEEKEMRRRLLDVESSFLPEPDPQTLPTTFAGADDTYIYGGSPTKQPVDETTQPESQQEPEQSAEDATVEKHDVEPPTPSEAYQTPHPGRYAMDSDDDGHEGEATESTESSGGPTSSPAAAAAQRTINRAVSAASLGSKSTRSQPQHDRNTSIASQASTSSLRSKASTVKAPSSPPPQTDGNSESHTDTSSVGFNTTRSSEALPIRLTKRPSFLSRRQTSQRSSVSSYTGKSDYSIETPSDATLGADYALQSGGAMPASGSINRPNGALSRLPSLGSVASSMSNFSETAAAFERARNSSTVTSTPNDTTLESLKEAEKESSVSPPETPRPGSRHVNAPTDTVIAQHVRNIQVPDTVAKEYREKFRSRSPDKRMSVTPMLGRNKGSLTLKEQNSKIDKLSKENFDLKLKIHFLDQALQNRSDEGVKDMIQKNVQYQTDLANEKKDNQSLRRKIRELERKLKEKEDGVPAPRTTSAGSDDDKSMQSYRNAELEEEIIILRERLHYSETQVEKLREESLSKEVEKRRMAEYVKSMGDRRSSEPNAGVEEAMDMWKDLLEAETARREQADEDAHKLREEVARLKSELTAANNETANQLKAHIFGTKRHLAPYASSRSVASDMSHEPNGTVDSNATLVDQLRHENAELRRDLGAQTSMLTSRNRERERLQQEIEELKLHQRRGVGSVAGDSIFERSVSRANQRPVSRNSALSRPTQLSDVERDEYESKTAALRDENANLKMLNQDLERELNTHLDLLTQAEADLRALAEEKDLMTDDLQQLQAERDQVLADNQEQALQYRDLEQEAIGAIEGLEADLEQKDQQFNQLALELEARNEDFAALQQEIKIASERLIHLEDDAVASKRRIQALEQELEEANRDLEELDKRLRETQEKNERMEVQQESNLGEISFLREEQEADKVKIGDLEAALRAAEAGIQEEKERFRELEERLAEEHRQREILDNQEKAEVQKVIDELNTQLSKARDEVRRLRKSLSSKEVEATTWKSRLDELENSLREALGSLDGTRSTLVKDITKLQQDLDATMHELDGTKQALAEKERMVRHQTNRLEDSALETRRVSDLLDKERQARKQDRHQFELSQRQHHNTDRVINQHQLRITELEAAHSSQGRKFANVEASYRDQLLERNNLLLALWNRLSTLCGTDWARKHSLVGGKDVPSLEVIARNLPGFSKNVILAVKYVESLVGGFKERIRTIERDLWKDFQTLEHTLDVRVKRLEQLEKAVHAGSIGRISLSRTSSRSDTSEIQGLKKKVKTLEAELNFARQNPPMYTPNYDAPRSPSIGTVNGGSARDRASVAATLLRHHSTSAVEVLERQQHQQQHGDHKQQQVLSPPLAPSEQRWIHRLKELERRLKAEREARLLDRRGARKRLEERDAENEELRRVVERERLRRGSTEG